MLGPFTICPFDAMHILLFMARSKPDGVTHVIVDLCPHGSSVSSCRLIGTLDKVEFKLKYPTIDNVIHKLRLMGPDTLMFKLDLQCAFRNFWIDKLDYHTFGLQWHNMTYIDVALPFGFKQASSSCQMATDTITYFLWTQNIRIMTYLDNLLGVADLDTGCFSHVIKSFSSFRLAIQFEESQIS